eukprot:318854-Chlamydomonas_euryale.AAC.4
MQREEALAVDRHERAHDDVAVAGGVKLVDLELAAQEKGAGCVQAVGHEKCEERVCGKGVWKVGGAVFGPSSCREGRKGRGEGGEMGAAAGYEIKCTLQYVHLVAIGAGQYGAGQYGAGQYVHLVAIGAGGEKIKGTKEGAAMDKRSTQPVAPACVETCRDMWGQVKETGPERLQATS